MFIHYFLLVIFITYQKAGLTLLPPLVRQSIQSAEPPLYDSINPDAPKLELVTKLIPPVNARAKLSLLLRTVKTLQLLLIFQPGN